MPQRLYTSTGIYNLEVCQTIRFVDSTCTLRLEYRHMHLIDVGEEFSMNDFTYMLHDGASIRIADSGKVTPATLESFRSTPGDDTQCGT